MTNDTDWVLQDQKFQLELEQEKTRQIRIKRDTRVQIWQAVSIALGIIFVLAIVAGGLVYSVEQSSKRSTTERLECIKSGGTMVDIKAGRPLCLKLEGGTDG